MADLPEDLDSKNEELDELEPKLEDTDLEPSDDDSDDVKALKEKLKNSDGNNKQLFARAKKGEGFTLEDGKWVKKPAEIKPPEKPSEKPTEKADAFSMEDLDKKLEEREIKRDIAGLDAADAFKSEIQAYVDVKGGTVAEALATPYFKFQKEEADKAADAEAASLEGGGSGKGAAKVDPSKINPADLDLRTEDGQKKFKAWEEHISKQLG